MEMIGESEEINAKKEKAFKLIIKSEGSEQ